VAVQAPGDLLSLDTFYVGKLKGVGKVWQITGCDVASSFGWAQLVLGEVTAAAVLASLRDVVRPGYRCAGWRLKRVLTDNGKEFKGEFALGCDRLRIRVTRTKPRHAWTNGFVERLEKSPSARAVARRLSAAVLHRPPGAGVIATNLVNRTRQL
jgi:transposase InsO family protein